MKNSFVKCLLGSALLWSGVTGAETQTHLTVRCFPGQDLVKVEAVLQDSVHSNQPRIEFLLSQHLDSLEVFFETEQDRIAAGVEWRNGDTATVELPDHVRSLSHWQLRMSYLLPAESGEDSVLILDRGHRWYPILRDRLTSATVIVRVPEGFRVLSVGDLMEESSGGGLRTAQFMTKIPVYKIPLVIAPQDHFRVRTISCGSKDVTDITVLGHTLSDSSLAIVAAEACSIFVHITSLLGAYHHRTLTLVEVGHFSGMNIGTGIVTIGSAMMHEVAKGNFEGLHLCVAQQWLGAGVFVRFPSAGFWLLTVSLPHHLRIGYELRYADEITRQSRWLRQLDRYRSFAGSETDLPLIGIDMPNTTEKGILIYAKGPALFEVTRRCLGAEKWAKFLKTLYAEKVGRQIDWRAFLDALLPFDSEGGCTSVLIEMTALRALPPLQ